MGPVQFSLETRRKKNSATQLRVKGKADRLDLGPDATKIILTGNVSIESNDASFSGEMEADKAIITLNEKREIADLELFGNPGRSKLQK
jgi:lipopolysaccharide export system protein LptA